MNIRDAEFSKRVEAAVTAIEARTDAELVVVAASRSAPYRDLVFGAATAVTFGLLLALEAVPFAIHPWAMVADLAIAWPVAAWIASSDRITRWLLGSARARQAVSLAAAAEFHREGVHATPNRSGLLIYVSTLEQRVEIILDLGLEARIPMGRFASARAHFAHLDLDPFITGLEAIGDVLAEHVPHNEDSDAVDLPNAPRIRS